MEEDQEQGHVCRFCEKHFPCGRSLGGHMRSHMRNAPLKKNEKLEGKKLAYSTAINGGSNTSLVDFEGGEQVGYGLRENPKKTWRLSDSNDSGFKEEKFCSECGKGFQSARALFGHMASHSEKERVGDSLEEDSWIDGHMDSQSETEAAAPKRGRRSRRARYKNTSTVTASSSLSLSFANAASYVSEVEQEREDVARCLMMLSRDVGYWGGVKSVSVESSDNNYVAGEVRSLEMENSEHAQEAELGQSEFGGSRNVLKKLESAVSVDGPTAAHKFKKPKSDNRRTGFEVSKVELGEVYSMKKLKCSEAELRKNLIKEANDQIDLECGKRNSGKRSSGCGYDPHTLDHYYKKIKCVGMDSPSKSKFECVVCHKVFNSYQALGGHRASHKRTNSCCALKTESAETSIEIRSPSTNSSIDKDGASCVEATYGSLKKIKHECPTCFKVFASGQALGGHKRTHALDASEDRDKKATVIPEQLPVIRDLLDLNLPAQDEEESNVGIGFEQWWAGNNQNHEQAVGAIFN